MQTPITDPNPCQFFHFQHSCVRRSSGPFSLIIQQVVYGFGGTSWGPVFLTNTSCCSFLFRLIHFSCWTMKRCKIFLSTAGQLHYGRKHRTKLSINQAECWWDRWTGKQKVQGLPAFLISSSWLLNHWVYVSLVGKGKLVKVHFYALWFHFISSYQTSTIVHLLLNF